MARFTGTARFQPHNERCPECGCVFFKDEHWKKICYDCWRAANRPSERSKPRALSDGRVQGSDLGNLALENASLRAELTTIRNELAEVRADNRRLARMIVALEVQSKLALEPEMVKRLLYLCHPDKHNNSKPSIIATDYLIGLKRD